MKPRIVALVPLTVALLLAACSLAQTGIGPKGAASTAASDSDGTAGPADAVSITNDTARGTALYTGSSGPAEAIAAPDPSSDRSVACTAATSYAVVRPSGDADTLPAGVIVVGTRGDGSPGAWEIDPKGRISLVQKEWGGRAGDLSPERDEAPEGLHRQLGWSYHVTAVSSDGRMIVGYAENAAGYTRGSIAVPAGATVGIYWRVLPGPKGRHSLLSPPSVVGTADGARGHRGDDRSRTHRPHSETLTALRLFFLGRLQSYLIMTSAVQPDSAHGAYRVTGTDQDGSAAAATIFRDGSIVIEPISAPPAGYGEVIIDTYFPTGPGYGYDVDVIGLFSETGVVDSQNPWTDPAAGTLAVDGESGKGSNPSPSQEGYAYIDYKPATPLPSGTVLYVRVAGYSTSGSSTGADATVAPYALRVLTVPSTAYSYYTTNAAADVYEPDGAPTSGGVPTSPIAMAPGQSINSYLSPAGDVDWIKITLP